MSWYARCIILSILIVPGIEAVHAKRGEPMFLKLETVFTYEEPSETKVEFADGSSFSFACQSYSSERGVIALGDRPVPVVRIRCSGERPRAGSVIWLHGGPFDTFDPEVGGEQAALLSLGYEIIAPLYIGSRARELTMRDGVVTPGMDEALAEIEVALKWAQKRDRRVILYGTSYGAFLAAAVSPRLRRTDRLVLHNPMLRPLRAVLPERHPSAPVGGQEQALANVPEEQLGFSRSVATAFFGRWLERDLLDLLSSDPPRHLFVVYGDGDKRIGMERIDELLALASGKPLILKNSDHEPIANRQELDAFIEGVRR